MTRFVSATAAMRTSSLCPAGVVVGNSFAVGSSDLDCDGGFDAGMVLVVLDFEVIKLIFAECVGFPENLQRRWWKWIAAELLFDLVHMIIIDMTVSAGPDELSDVEIRLLCDDVQQQRIGRDIKWNAKKHVCAPLIELAAQRPVYYIELKHHMARWECHLRDFVNLPRRHDYASGIRIVTDEIQRLIQLVMDAPVFPFPSTPLFSIDWSQIALRICPLIPNGHTSIIEIFDICVATKKPKQLVNDTPYMKSLCCNHWKPFSEIKSHLVPESAYRAGTGTIALLVADFQNVFERVEISSHKMA